MFYTNTQIHDCTSITELLLPAERKAGCWEPKDGKHDNRKMVNMAMREMACHSYCENESLPTQGTVV